MSRTEALSTMARPRFDAGPTPLAPLLIQVPELRVHRFRPHQARQGSAWPQHKASRRVRRRLRREVRVAAFVLMGTFLLGITWLAWPVGGSDRWPVTLSWARAGRDLRGSL